MLSEKPEGNYEVIEDRYKAIEAGINRLESNDMLLILGKGHENYIIVKDKKIPHNDHKAVEEIISKK